MRFVLVLLVFILMIPLSIGAKVTPNCGDLGELEGSVIANHIIDFDVTKDNNGDLVAAYSYSDGGMAISLAKMDATGKWRYIPVQIPLFSTTTTSITFMEDSEGVYWIAYATRENLGRIGVDTRINTSIWLSESRDKGGTWSSPIRVVSYNSLHESNFGIWDLSIVEDNLGGLWLVWNHVYRRQRKTYYTKSDDRGSTWISTRSFGFEKNRYEDFFLDHQGNLHFVYITSVYLGRGPLGQLVSLDYGNNVRWLPELKRLGGIEDITRDVFYAAFFSEVNHNSTQIWITWMDNDLEGSNKQDIVVLGSSPDAGLNWELYGFFTVPNYKTGDQYIVIPQSTDEQITDQLGLLWISRSKELVYTSIPDLSLISSAILISLAGTHFTKKKEIITIYS